MTGPLRAQPQVDSVNERFKHAFSILAATDGGWSKIKILVKHFREIKLSPFKAAFEIISPRAHSRNDSHTLKSIRLRNGLCLFE
jgi:hypothetical protein